jgi:long-subunit fatty acid transport protein
VAIALCFALLVARGAVAQNLLRIDFNFSNPGARSLGFGGAFAGLADDATAAFANPAGLVQLTRPEVSLEGRSWDASTSFIAGGRIEGEPTGMGIDTRNGFAFGHDEDRVSSPSFASFVWPRGRWTLAVYGHRLARLTTASESQGLFVGEEDNFPFFYRSPATRDRADLTVETAGVAVGWRMDDRLSLGLALVHTDASVLVHRDEFWFDENTLASIYGPITFRPERQVAATTISIDGTDQTLTAGLLWSVNERVSTGLFFRQGAEVGGRYRTTVAFPPGSRADTFELEAALHVPDVFGAAAAYRSPSGRITLAGEVDRVGYAGLFEVTATDEFEGAVREYEDGWQVRVGGEYALLDRQPVVALRAGSWLETQSNDEHDRITHVAAGVGIAGERIQLDLAADHSSVIDTLSLSVIYSF